MNIQSNVGYEINNYDPSSGRSGRERSIYEQSKAAFALANTQPGKVAELLGKVPKNYFIDEMYHAQIKNIDM